MFVYRTQDWSENVEIQSCPLLTRKLVAMRAFQRGEVTCDYHGRYLKVPKQGGNYLMTIENSSEFKEIDSEDGCPCHGKTVGELAGAMINYSPRDSRRANAYTSSLTIYYEMKPLDIIVFRAKKNIRRDFTSPTTISH